MSEAPPEIKAKPCPRCGKLRVWFGRYCGLCIECCHHPKEVNQ